MGKNVSLSKVSTFAAIFMFFFSQQITRGFLASTAYWFDQIKLKYILLFFACTFNILLVMRNYGGQVVLFPEKKFKKEIGLYLFGIATLAIITMFYQVQNGFKSYAISEVLYLVSPLILVWTFLMISDYRVDELIDSLYVSSIIIFLLQNYMNFTPSAIGSINFMNSYSPFEGGLSNLMIFYEIYYLYRNKKGRAIICTVITCLCLKRISVIMSLVLLFCYPVIKNFDRNKILVRRLAYVAAAIFIVLTPLLVLFYSEPVAVFFETKFNIVDFNVLTMDRYRRTLLVSENLDQIKYGLGSTTEYITNFLPASVSIANRNLHCDLLRLYFECGFVGLTVFVISYFKTCTVSINALLVIFISFLDLIFNHTLLGGGNAGLWALIYFLVYKFNYTLDG